MKTKKEYVLGIIAAPQDDAEHIARVIVEKRLAACIQIAGPISSFYWWKGKVEKDTEALMFIKTKEKCTKSIEEVLKTIHPYEIPELIFLPISAGLPSYFNWIDETVSAAPV
ncbi:MAG: divalent-cation tolerance protein CutA [Spirochaetales bacterium]|nr:divalent-cation tolerance protein CutA [Spirochaetales bacterium]